ncbi:hypothetical protein BR93DRAFT_957097 [Coniochaeta sp. PMI_546]|nr:hypothetical protein BR93DRAFT_957097 [Coniochaeta sp. PMI_546]
MTPMPTAIGSSPLNTTLFNSTIPEGELPLTPRVTPAYAVGGVILIGTGLGYGLAGIRSNWVHSFMAAAYLASLGTSILILYVMTPPISNAIQGAYLIAIVCTGLLLGGAALVFKEITECLGSLLGGFCLSMWLLTLSSGGLVHQTGPKVGIILAVTLGAFATYFSRWTRSYALMACISFAGATAAVLGIDCFSQAGLKEFWAYIWALNDHLFPLGVDTYPVTKGIKVELVATILLFIAGMMSQLKLWRVIQKKRDQRERQRAEGQRAAEREDLNIGQHVERMTYRERRQWERVYGDGAEKGFADSGVGDTGSEGKLASRGTLVRSSRVVSPTSNDGQFQMVEIPLDDDGVPSRRRTVLFQNTRAARASARRSQAGLEAGHASESDNPGADVPKIWVVGSNGEARFDEAARTSSTFLPQPKVVPLPFTVPIGDEDDVLDDGSSVGAHVEGYGENRSLPESRRNSLAKRLSIGSGKILRSLSQRSRAQTVATVEGGGESSEDLVLSTQSRLNDDNSSLAATLDDLSSEGMGSDTGMEGSRRYSDVEPPLSQELRKREEKSTQSWLSPSASLSGDLRLSTAEGDSSRPQSGMAEEDVTVRAPSEKPVGDEIVGSPSLEDAAGSLEGPYSASLRSKSYVSVESRPALLKPEHLPQPLSRVALSYRTNEWAKHLSHAEAPEPDNQQGKQNPGSAVEPVVEEPAAPVDVEELQKTADNAVRPVAAPRSASAMSNHSAAPQPISRTNSKASLSQAESRNISPTGQSFPSQVHKNPKRGASNRRPSAQLPAEAIAEEDDGEVMVSSSPTVPEEEGTTSATRSTSSSPSPVEPIQISRSASGSNLNPARPPVPGVVSYSSPQTLIGQRELLLRNKSQASFYLSPTPEPSNLATIHSLASSDAGSIYNHPVGLGLPSSVRTSLENNPDLDDLPLSQRRHILRQSSIDLPPPQQSYQHPANVASTANFDSHQPIHRRVSGAYVPTEAARQAQLANFRTSVQAELRQGTAFAGPGYGAPGNAGWNTSAANIYGAGAGGWNADVKRSVDQQRNFLMSQKEAEARRREMERVSRERSNAEFEERMRTGELLGAHRDAMRRLQGGVRDL